MSKQKITKELVAETATAAKKIGKTEKKREIAPIRGKPEETKELREEKKTRWTVLAAKKLWKVRKTEELTLTIRNF